MSDIQMMVFRGIFDNQLFNCNSCHFRTCTNICSTFCQKLPPGRGEERGRREGRGGEREGGNGRDGEVGGRMGG